MKVPGNLTQHKTKTVKKEELLIMNYLKKHLGLATQLIFIFAFFIGCASTGAQPKVSQALPVPALKEPDTNVPPPLGFYSIVNTADSYKKAGIWWGEKLMHNGVKSGDIDNELVNKLIVSTEEPGGINYFFVHTERKQAFHHGFLQGYKGRSGDLVLGPNIAKAGGKLGTYIAEEFVRHIKEFEENWRKVLKKSVDVFITLVAEGSHADRQEFVNNFTEIYKNRYLETESKNTQYDPIITQGGTFIKVQMSEAAALGIPSDVAIKTEFFKQTFYVIGDEMGRRFRHNLIKRSDLIDFLRRLSPVFHEASSKRMSPKMGLERVLVGFQDGYRNVDASVVFDEMAKEASLYKSLS